jgi:hypothetical protein
MRTESRNDQALKGLDGSNPVRSPQPGFVFESYRPSSAYLRRMSDCRDPLRR